MQTDIQHYRHLARELQELQRNRQPPPPHPLIAPLRPIRARLTGHDFWQLQEHRRRCEAGEYNPRPLLAAFLRAKLSDAEIGPPDGQTLTGTNAGLCRIDDKAPHWVRLYHWTPPGKPGPWPDRAVATSSWLGAILIGMRAGQSLRLPDRVPGAPRHIRLLRVSPAFPPDTAIAG